MSDPPRLLYLRRADVEAVGGGRVELYAEALRTALIAHAGGRTVQPLKPYLRANADGGHIADRIIAMPAHVDDGGGDGVSGIKWVGSKHDNPERVGRERASAVIVLNDPQTNYPVAILEGALISAWRTAAVTCLAAERLARRDFATVALIGCGVIGATQARALLQHFGQIATIVLYDQRPAAAHALARELADAVAVRVTATAEQAVRAGDVVVPCTVTDRPYIEFDWLARGAFLSNVSIMDVHEDVFVAADKVVVDDWDQSCRERKILHRLVLDGRFSRERLHAELGEILAGTRPGRESDDEIVLLNPMGMAIEDIACAAAIHARALEAGVGTWLDLY